MQLEVSFAEVRSIMLWAVRFTLKQLDSSQQGELAARILSQAVSWEA